MYYGCDVMKKKNLTAVLRICLLIICFVSILALSSCGSNSNKTSKDEKAKKNTEIYQIDKDDKENKEEAVNEKKNTNDASQNKNESTSKSKSSKSKSTNSTSSTGKKKVWVPAVYKTVDHPAVTHTEKLYRCACGRDFSSPDDWEAHRPKPCDGNHRTYRIVTNVVVDQPAWSEQVLVTPGHYE